jgi:hypothetical protein
VRPAAWFFDTTAKSDKDKPPMGEDKRLGFSGEIVSCRVPGGKPILLYLLPSVAGLSAVAGQAFIAGQEFMALRPIFSPPACTARKPAKADEYWARGRFFPQMIFALKVTKDSQKIRGQMSTGNPHCR